MFISSAPPQLFRHHRNYEQHHVDFTMCVMGLREITEYQSTRRLWKLHLPLAIAPSKPKEHGIIREFDIPSSLDRSWHLLMQQDLDIYQITAIVLP